MCKCIEESEENIRKHIVAQNDFKEGFEMLEGKYQNRPWLMLGDGSIKLYSTFKYTYTFKKVNGETSKAKSETVNIFHAYCPICGVKHED